jgi:hypothetical protein
MKMALNFKSDEVKLHAFKFFLCQLVHVPQLEEQKTKLKLFQIPN